MTESNNDAMESFTEAYGLSLVFKQMERELKDAQDEIKELKSINCCYVETMTRFYEDSWTSGLSLLSCDKGKMFADYVEGLRKALDQLGLGAEVERCKNRWMLAGGGYGEPILTQEDFNAAVDKMLMEHDEDEVAKKESKDGE